VGSCRREILDHVIPLNEPTSPSADPRVRELPPRRSNSR
jgi:hypothetical protein